MHRCRKHGGPSNRISKYEANVYQQLRPPARPSALAFSGHPACGGNGLRDGPAGAQHGKGVNHQSGAEKGTLRLPSLQRLAYRSNRLRVVHFPMAEVVHFPMAGSRSGGGEFASGLYTLLYTLSTSAMQRHAMSP